LTLASRPENERLSTYLQAQAHRGDQPSGFDIDEFELHCHPDLIEHLVALGGSYVACYGLPVLVHENGIAFAFAQGTSTLLLRLPPAIQIEVLDAKDSSDRNRARFARQRFVWRRNWGRSGWPPTPGPTR
jgi:hypothetical protein